ncbi:hypothetical protein [Bacillus sp. X1(2014)]|nr:hypothetical protein [Bacillus sp. X1(2014)]
MVIIRAMMTKFFRLSREKGHHPGDDDQILSTNQRKRSSSGR